MYRQNIDVEILRTWDIEMSSFDVEILRTWDIKMSVFLYNPQPF